MASLPESETIIPIFFTLGFLTVAGWLILRPRLAVGLLLFSLVAGQLVRVPWPGQGGGILISDIAVVLVLFSALLTVFSRESANKFPISNFQLLNKPQTPNAKHKTLNDFFYFLFSIFLFFILWSGFTLVIKDDNLGLSNFLIALAYWVRLVCHILLLPALLFLFRDGSLRKYGQRGLIFVTGVLVLAGLVQFFWLPDIAVVNSFRLAWRFISFDGRWDPHQWRMVSTWLDPNFFGAFLVMMLPIMIMWQRRWWFGAAAVTAALLGTQSRSALVSLGLALILLTPWWLMVWLRRRQLGRLMAAASVAGITIAFFILAGLMYSSRLASLITLGPTVQLRLNSMSQAWQVARDHAWLGVGYNAYQFAAKEYGFISDFGIHSRAGVDNSLLLLWATTGLVGLGLFLIPWVYIGRELLIRVIFQKNIVALAVLVSLVAWFIDAQFINSLLYPHLIITMAVILAVTINELEGLEKR